VVPSDNYPRRHLSGTPRNFGKPVALPSIIHGVICDPLRRLPGNGLGSRPVLCGVFLGEAMPVPPVGPGAVRGQVGSQGGSLDKSLPYIPEAKKPLPGWGGAIRLGGPGKSAEGRRGAEPRAPLWPRGFFGLLLTLGYRIQSKALTADRYAVTSNAFRATQTTNASHPPTPPTPPPPGFFFFKIHAKKRFWAPGRKSICFFPFFFPFAVVCFFCFFFIPCGFFFFFFFFFFCFLGGRGKTIFPDSKRKP